MVCGVVYGTPHAFTVPGRLFGGGIFVHLDHWKAVFLEQRANTLQIWREPFVELRIPLLFNLRREPFEKAQIDANVYHDCFLDRAYVLVPMQ